MGDIKDLLQNLGSFGNTNNGGDDNYTDSSDGDNDTNPLDILDTIGNDNPGDTPNEGNVSDEEGNEYTLDLDDDKINRK